MKNKIIKNKEKGFTIVEILVSIGVFSIVLLAIISFVFWMNFYNAKTKADREVAENAKRILDIITYEIRGSKSIYTPTTTVNQLSLETTKYLPDGQTNTFIDFFLCESSICMKKEFQDPVKINSDSVDISNLSFLQIINGSQSTVKIQQHH